MRPARQVVKRAPHRTVGLVVAPWLQPEPIEHESFLEKGFIEMAMVCRSVTRIRHQPFEVEYTLDGVARRHVPDFLVLLEHGVTLIVEVKPAKFVERYQAKFDAVSVLLQDRGMTYFVVTDEQMPKQAVEQARLWRRYARTTADPKTVQSVMAKLQSVGSLPLDQMASADINVSVIYHLLGRRLIESTDGLVITESTGLQLPKGLESGYERIHFERWFACQAWGEIPST